MPGLNLNIGTSVVKRESRPTEEVVAQLENDGWEMTGSIGGDRVLYFEKSGINITVMEGPMGTLVFPSGPVRGRLFGNSGLMAGKKSVLGTGRVEGEAGRQARKAKKKANTLV